MAAIQAEIGLVLAGGGGVRVGGRDKGALMLDGEALGLRVCRRLAPQARRLIVASPNAHSWTSDLDKAVDQIHDVTDADGAQIGPLGGVLAGLERASDLGLTDGWAVTAPIDSPFFPTDLATRLIEGALQKGVPAAFARTADRDHPVFTAWQIAAAVDLRIRVMTDGRRALHGVLTDIGAAAVAWPLHRTPPFFNINTLSDLSRAEALMAAAD